MEENRSTITYDENWQSVSEPETPVIVSSEETEAQALPPNTRKAAAPRQLLLTIQLALCILLAAAAFALKNIGGEVYEAARAWYETHLNDTLMFDGSGGLEALLPAATADEA